MSHQLGDEQTPVHLPEQCIPLQRSGDQGGRSSRCDGEVVDTTGVARSLHPELARRIAVENIPLQNPLPYQIPLAGGNPLLIEGCTAQRPFQVGLLIDAHKLRKDRLSEPIQQKTGLAIECAATYRPNEMGKQGTGHLGAEQDRNLGGGEPSRPQAAHGPFRSPSANRFLGLQPVRIAGGGVPEVPLHLLAFGGYDAAAHAMAGGGIGAEETMTVTIDMESGVAVHRRPLRVPDPGIGRQGRPFASSGQLDGILHRQIPGMIEIQIRDLPRHRFRRRQPVTWILRCVAGDLTGRFHRLLHRVGTEFRGTGRSLALSKIDGDPHPLVPVVLDGLHLTLAHRYRQPGRQVATHLRSRCPTTARLVEQPAHQFAETFHIELPGNIFRNRILFHQLGIP